MEHIYGLSGKELYDQALVFKEKQDFDNYVIYLTMAANYQYPDAIDIFDNSEEQEQYYSQNIKFFKDSVDRLDQNSYSLLNLSIIYKEGLGVVKDHKEAFRLVELSAEKGNRNALNRLATCYNGNHGIKQNYNKAKELYELAIDKGNIDAITNLAIMYQKSYGVERDYDKAIELYALAIEKNDVRALLYLGDMYEEGYGVVKDYAKSIELYELAIDKGNIDAITNLGIMYQRGTGVARDYAKAIELYRLAIEKNDVRALLHLADMYEAGHGVEKDYDKVIELYELAIEKGNVAAITNLAIIYQNGTIVEKNYEKAIKLYELAIKKNHVRAIKYLAYLYENMERYDDAIKLYEMAIEKNSKNTYNKLALMYHNGKGTEKNYERANELYRAGIMLANKLGRNTDTIYINIIELYKNGYKEAKYTLKMELHKAPVRVILFLADIYNSIKKYNKALKLYELAINRGSARACTKMAHYYRRGLGIDINYDKAAELYKLAIDRGYDKSYSILISMYVYRMKKYDEALELLQKLFEKGDTGSLKSIIGIFKNQYYKDKQRKVIEYLYEINQLDKLKDIYDFNDYVIDCIKKKYELESLVTKLQKENQDLKTHIESSPDGTLYFEAKKEWEQLI